VDTKTKYITSFINAKLAAGRQQSTISYYQNTLSQLLRFVSTWPPTPADLRAYLLHKRQTCNPVTVHTAYKSAHSFLCWCETEGLLETNPIRKIDRPIANRPLPKAVSLGAMKQFIRAIEHPAAQGDKFAVRDLALFRLAYDTGCRASELANLQIDNLDLQYGSILVEKGKGGKDRVVFFGEKTAAALADWLVIHPGGPWLFVGRFRTVIIKLSRRGILYSVKKWGTQAGVKLTVHQLRHSYATHALRRGIDLRHIQHQMGHSDITTTAIYLAVDDEDRRRAHREKSPGDAV
jgi:integrase/recombinase XerD